jgi:hypothetical protein
MSIELVGKDYKPLCISQSTSESRSPSATGATLDLLNQRVVQRQLFRYRDSAPTRGSWHSSSTLIDNRSAESTSLVQRDSSDCRCSATPWRLAFELDLTVLTPIRCRWPSALDLDARAGCLPAWLRAIVCRPASALETWAGWSRGLAVTGARPVTCAVANTTGSVRSSPASSPPLPALTLEPALCFGGVDSFQEKFLQIARRLSVAAYTLHQVGRLAALHRHPLPYRSTATQRGHRRREPIHLTTPNINNDTENPFGRRDLSGGTRRVSCAHEPTNLSRAGHGPSADHKPATRPRLLRSSIPEPRSSTDR